MDEGIIMYVQEHLRNPALTDIFIRITYLGSRMAVWIFISAALLLFKKTRKVGFMCICALLTSYVINNIAIKNIIARPRPYESIKNLVVLIDRPESYSFPSGHAASSFATAIVLYRNLPKKAGISALVLALLIALSRVYLGVHYPSDILCGMVFGTIAGYIGEIIAKKISICYNGLINKRNR